MLHALFICIAIAAAKIRGGEMKALIGHHVSFYRLKILTAIVWTGHEWEKRYEVSSELRAKLFGVRISAPFAFDCRMAAGLIKPGNI
jgi:hypothetical protein